MNVSSSGFLEGPSDTLSVLGPKRSQFNSVEIFGDEVSMVLNSMSLFRDTAYTVILPVADDFVDRIHRCIIGTPQLVVPEIYQGSPWGTMRYYIMVSPLLFF